MLHSKQMEALLTRRPSQDFWVRFHNEQSKGNKCILFKREIFRLIRVDSPLVELRRIDSSVKIASSYKLIYVQEQYTGYVCCKRKNCILAYKDMACFRNLRRHASLCVAQSSTTPSPPPPSIINEIAIPGQVEFGHIRSIELSSAIVAPSFPQRLFIPNHQVTAMPNNGSLKISSDELKKALQLNRPGAYDQVFKAFSQAVTAFRDLVKTIEEQMAKETFVQSYAEFILKKSDLKSGLANLVELERRLDDQTNKAQLLDEILFLVNKRMTLDDQADFKQRDLQILLSFFSGQLNTFQSMSLM